MLRPLLPILFVLLLPIPAEAIGTLQGDDASLEAIGALRLTGAYLHYPDAPGLLPDEDDGLAAGVVRLILEGEVGERLDYEFNGYVDLSRVPSIMTGGALATAGSFTSPYRYKYLSWDFWQDGAIHGQLGLDRLSVKLHLAPVDLSVGRQPINYSVTQMFAPNDVFAPFSATAINKIYKPGVDALRLNLALSAMSALELVGVLGADPGSDLASDSDDTIAWSHSALLLRANTVRWGFEWALLGGKLARRWMVGASLQGELGPLGLRAEGHAGFPDQDGDGTLDGSGETGREIYGHVAAGVDHQFVWRNATVGFEAMYASDGAPGPGRYLERMARLYPDDVPYLGRVYLGLSAGGEIMPILRLMIMGLINAEDGSGIGVLSLLYSISDEADFVGGLLVPWGARPDPGVLDLESEYGLAPLTVFLETRFYF